MAFVSLYKSIFSELSLMGSNHSKAKSNIEKIENKKDGKIKKGSIQQWNPISLNVSAFQSLKDKWDIDELKLLKQRVKKYRKTGIQQEQFLRIFPRLSSLSKESKDRVFMMFHRSDSKTLTYDDFLIGATLVKKSEDPSMVGYMTFFLYSMEKNMEKMDNQGYSKFVKENSSRLKEGSSLKEVSDWWPGRKTISSEEFIFQFKAFDHQKFILLFEEDYVVDEKILAEKLKERETFRREVGDEVYMVEFRWYMQWKSYMNFKYDVDPKIKDRTSRVNKEAEIRKSNAKFKTHHSIQYQHQTRVHAISKRPGVIPNYKLIGDDEHQLRENMKEFEDYVLVSAWLWTSLNKTYYGHPQIKRLYPQIYCLKIYEVFIDETATFIPEKAKKLQLVYNENYIKDIFKDNDFKDKVCMYKYAGKENWEPIPNIDEQIGSWAKNRKVFICLADKKIKEKFMQKYNVVNLPEGKKYVEERIKNYATMIKVPVSGFLRSAFVIGIKQNFVCAEFRNEENSKFKKQFNFQNLKKYNQNEYSDEDSLNPMAGFINRHDMHSYFNAVIQCLIRTPSFGIYLQRFQLDLREKDRNDQSQQLILWALSTIYSRSKNIKKLTIDSYRRAISKKVPMKIQQNHFDAHDFLVRLLKNLENEVADYREEFGRVAKTDRSVKSSASQTNIKIDQFFMSNVQQTIECEDCGSKNDNKANIYTHTITLPEHDELQVFFFFFPKEKNLDWKPQKYGIDGNKGMQKEEFLEKAYRLLNITAQNIKFYAMQNGQWIHDIVKDGKHKNMTEYVELGYKILAYEVAHEQSIQLEVRFRKQMNGKKFFKSYAAPLLVQIEDKQTWADVMDQITIALEGKFQDADSDKLAYSRASSRKSFKSTKDKTLRPRRKSIMASRATQFYRQAGDWSRVKFTSESVMEEPSNLESSRMLATSRMLDGSRMIEASSHMENANSEEITDNQKKDIKPPEYRISINKQVMNEGIIKSEDEDIPVTPFEIRIISKYENAQKCFFCRRYFKGHHYKRLIEISKCKGCTFKNAILPLKDQSFRNHVNEMVLVVDWDHQSIFNGFQHIKTDSAQQCEKLTENRRDDLNYLLNTNLEEKITISCSNALCKGKKATKTQRIQSFPNMLIVHIDRFEHRLHGLIKKKNHITYPDQLFYGGQKYELYGVVVHDGEVSREHYYSYVKLDDYDEWFICNDARVKPLGKYRNQHIHPDAYILFYKKSELEPALLFLNPQAVS